MLVHGCSPGLDRRARDRGCRVQSASHQAHVGDRSAHGTCRARRAGRRRASCRHRRTGGGDARKPDQRLAGGAVHVRHRYRGRGQWRRRDRVAALRRGAPAGPGRDPERRRHPERRADASAAGQDRLEPRVAVDAEGDAVFAWLRSDGTTFRVQARSRSSAGVLGAVQDISPAGQDTSEPEVAIDPLGNAVVAWTGSDGASSVVQARARSAAGALAPVQGISDPARKARPVGGRDRRRRRRRPRLAPKRRREHADRDAHADLGRCPRSGPGAL